MKVRELKPDAYVTDEKCLYLVVALDDQWVFLEDAGCVDKESGKLRVKKIARSEVLRSFRAVQPARV